MRERPILFSAPMVRAILAGKKTQTRRIIKPQPPKNIDAIHENALRKRAPYDVEHYETGHVVGRGFVDDDNNHYLCPYGTRGDRLWVRETWTPDHAAFYPNFPYVYRADQGHDYERNEKGEVYSPEQKAWYPYRWRPSIHMPRLASRITLEVVAVRVERLQDITEKDAIAEGFQETRGTDGNSYGVLGTAREAFESLWHEINGPESWLANPWVWVVEFQRVAKGGA